MDCEYQHQQQQLPVLRKDSATPTEHTLFERAPSIFQHRFGGWVCNACIHRKGLCRQALHAKLQLLGLMLLLVLVLLLLLLLVPEAVHDHHQYQEQYQCHSRLLREQGHTMPDFWMPWFLLTLLQLLCWVQMQKPANVAAVTAVTS